MKELNVECNLYLKVEDGVDAEEALKRLLECLERNGIDSQIWNYALQDN